MTKQEKIKEAWGEYWDSVSRYHQYEGWINRWAWDFRNDLEMDQLSGKDSPSLVRPKSLKGIENNNGWVRIDSEDDLPKETGHFWVCNKINNQVEIDYIDWDYESHIERWVEFNSHYIPIEKPKPPLY